MTVSVEVAVQEVVLGNPTAVADFDNGKTEALGFLVGLVMKATYGQQPDPAYVQALLRSAIEQENREWHGD